MRHLHKTNKRLFPINCHSYCESSPSKSPKLHFLISFKLYYWRFKCWMQVNFNIINILVQWVFPRSRSHKECPAVLVILIGLQDFGEIAYFYPISYFLFQTLDPGLKLLRVLLFHLFILILQEQLISWLEYCPAQRALFQIIHLVSLIDARLAKYMLAWLQLSWVEVRHQTNATSIIFWRWIHMNQIIKYWTRVISRSNYFWLQVA